MTAQDIDPANLTPADMDRLRAELQQQFMSRANAAEAADILAGMSDMHARVQGTLERLRVDAADMRATLARIEAELASRAEGDRRPRA
ncbi:hypothetical protein [Falsiroseomonas sp. E2-1-a20]|uniref:hypothetical protein n=1 Tax=Falsiroseomonas sp. E2-1-a20 TaxID=3239300 RepID=UPI003F3C9861